MRISEMILAWAVRWWCVCMATCDNTTNSATDYENNPSVNLFREYCRINTTSVGGNLTAAVEFWQTQAASIGLPVSVYEYTTGKPIVVITWEGSDPALPSIMLNSHMDVVPANEPGWLYPPFDAYMDENFDIYGRGTQDMKSVSIQYFEAIKLLMENNVTLSRTIHMTLMPDEELGGVDGMKKFIDTVEFDEMNVVFSLDEGIAYPNSSNVIFFAERAIWQFQCNCTGPGGHSSTLPADTAASKMLKVNQDFQNYRDEQSALLASGEDLGILTSVNLVMISGGGDANNIIPENIVAGYDMRIGVGSDETATAEMVNNFTVGHNCSLAFTLKDSLAAPTQLDDSNVCTVAFFDATQAMGMQVISIISPGGSDGRYVRTKGISVIGFSPMTNTPYLLHTRDERLNAQTFLDGIQTYYNILQYIANA